MTAAPILQFGTDAPIPHLVEVVLHSGDLVAAPLGLAIACLAWRGYRRSDSRPM